MDRALSAKVLERETGFLADLISNHYTSEDGGLFEKVDVSTGRAVDTDPAIDELGDYIQYIIYQGTSSPRVEYVDWGLKTLELITENYQSEKGLYYSGRGRNPFKKTLLTLNNSDTITGLVSSFLYTRNDGLKPVIERFIDGVFEYFSDGGYLTYGYLFGDRIKVALSSLLFTGYFLEEVLNYTECTGCRDYLPGVRAVVDKNLSSPYFLKHGIFQARIPLGFTGGLWGLFYRICKQDDLETTILVKDNIYFLFALIKYFSIVKEPNIKEVIEHTYDRLLKQFSRNGLRYNLWNPSKGCIGGVSNLALSHSLIELQLDLYHEFGDEGFLGQAVELTDQWLQRRSPIGVLRETVSDDDHYSLLDPNVDFAVNLLKLSQKTGNEVYRQRAFELAGGIVRYFKARRGYYWKVDSFNGTPIGKEIETKYLGLLLKLFIILSEVSKGRLIFEDPLLRNLARDR